MPKNKSLVYQVNKTLESKMRFGESKHTAKQQKDIHGRAHSYEGIYSYNTHKAYLVKCCAFAKWAKEHYGCRTLEQARKYVDNYIQDRIDRGYAPSTQKTISNALAKLYGFTSKDFIQTQPRRRVDITRSRQGKAKARFSESRNKEFVDFCKSTGLRRHEIENLRAENIRYDESTGQYMITNLKGKGGRIRECPILSNLSKETVKSILNTPHGQKVWSKVPANADIHSYRADYCAAIYERYARPVDEISKQNRYYCRKDLKGVVYDKRAMAVASRVLGHSRIGVIAVNYLHNVARKQLEGVSGNKNARSIAP